MGVKTVTPTSECLIETWLEYLSIRMDTHRHPNTRCLFAAKSQKGGVACYSISD
jgi:hypothetical protein